MRLALAGAFGPALVGVVLASLGSALGVTDPDVRLTWLAGGAVAALLLARLRRPGTDPRLAGVLLAMSLPLPLALVFPHNAWLVMWLSGGVLFLWTEAIVALFRATRAAIGAARGWIFASSSAAGAVVCLASFAIVLVNAQMSVVPARLAHQNPTLHAGERLISIQTADGHTLEGTYTPGILTTGFVLAHGVAGGRGRFDGWAARLGEAGHHVLRFDFRAHGLSDGSVCGYGQREHLDLQAAVSRLAGLAGSRPAEILVVGVSMGGGIALVASEALAARGVPGLVLLAPTSHYPPLVESRMWFIAPLLPVLLETATVPSRAAGLVPMHRYSPRLIAAPAASLPTLVFHGTADRDIPPRLSRELVRGREQTFLRWMEGVDHGGLTDAVLDDDEAWAELERFAEARFSGRRTNRR